MVKSNRALIVVGLSICLAAVALYMYFSGSEPVAVPKGDDAQHSIEWISLAVAILGFLTACVGFAKELISTSKK